MLIILVLIILVSIIVYNTAKKVHYIGNGPLEVILVSKSDLKKEALSNALNKVYKKPFTITTVDSSKANIPNQPVDCGKECAEYRIEYVGTNGQFIIAVEGAANKIDGNYYEIADVVAEYEGNKYYGISDKVLCDMNPAQKKQFEAQEKIYLENTKIWGYNRMGKDFLDDPNGFNPNRKEQIENGFIDVLKQIFM